MPDFPAVETILPHRDPAIVVDRIISCENDTVRCERKVRDCEHYGPGLSPEGIIEFCAQAAICGETVNASGAPKMGVIAGVIAGIDDFQFFKDTVRGDVLIAEIVARTRFGKLCLFECTVSKNALRALRAEKIAHGFIKAALT